MEVIADRFSLNKDKQELLWSKVSGARRVEAAVIEAPNKKHKVDLDDAALTAAEHLLTPLQSDKDDSKALDLLNRQLSESTDKMALVGLQLGLLESRLRYLRLATRRWEKLCADFVAASAAAAADTAAAAKPKGKAKKQSGGPTSAPEAICGFDVRLVTSDEDWAAFVESDKGQQLLALDEPAEGEPGSGDIGPQESYEDVLCMAPRKKCERHKGWQQVRDADFQVEYSAVVSGLSASPNTSSRLTDALVTLTGNSPRPAQSARPPPQIQDRRARGRRTLPRAVPGTSRGTLEWTGGVAR